jgi:hypothetical protein
MSNVNLSETAPTELQDIGGVSLAYRHFGKEGAAPVVCFQHFTGTINNFDPIHTNRLAQDRPVILRRARPGSSGSPRESWTAIQKRSPRSARPSLSLLLNGVRSPRQAAMAI